jgi:putative transposase
MVFTAQPYPRCVGSLDIRDAPTALHSPWQNPIIARIIGTLRRECLNHVIALNEAHLRRLLDKYLDRYHLSRTLLSLNKNSPTRRPIELRTDENVIDVSRARRSESPVFTGRRMTI